MNNNLTIIGHVGQAPRAVSFANTGNKVVKFSIAVKEFSNNEESTLWIDVDAWNGLGENVLATITKGREVVLNGRLAINVFTKEVNGVKTEVHKPILKLLSFHLCGPKPSNGSGTQSQSTAEAPAAAAAETEIKQEAAEPAEPVTAQRAEVPAAANKKARSRK